MPEMTFTVRWPDGVIADCYSPSLVMHDHLEVGASYPLDQFVAKSSEALDIASARVRAKYGFECTSAMQQKSEIVAAASAFPSTAIVEVVAMHPALGA